MSERPVAIMALLMSGVAVVTVADAWADTASYRIYWFILSIELVAICTLYLLAWDLPSLFKQVHSGMTTSSLSHVALAAKALAFTLTSVVAFWAEQHRQTAIDLIDTIGMEASLIKSSDSGMVMIISFFMIGFGWRLLKTFASRNS